MRTPSALGTTDADCPICHGVNWETCSHGIHVRSQSTRQSEGAQELMAVRELVAAYVNDTTTRTAAETLQAISDVLSHRGIQGPFTDADLIAAGQDWGDSAPLPVAAPPECTCPQFKCPVHTFAESAPLAAEEGLIERLEKHTEELRTQAGIFSRRNWGVLNDSGNVEVAPTLLDALSVRLEQAAADVQSAVAALRGRGASTK